MTPFRVHGYDALRSHNIETDSVWLADFLAPQLSTLYGLEDVQGFDPLIPARYAQLVEATAGLPLYADRLRNVEADRPDERLLRLLGVRYVVGHPFDRRMMSMPVTVSTGSAVAAVTPPEGWPDRPLTHWSFVSLVDGREDFAVGDEVARLNIVAEEGVFSFPVRVGIESAHVRALSLPGVVDAPGFRALVNSRWRMPVPLARHDYAVWNANWRGRIAFPRPLRVRSAYWELTDPQAVFYVASQAAGLLPADDEAGRWRLIHGTPEDVAPVYGHAAATARAELYATGEGEAPPDLDRLSAPGDGGRVEWLHYGRGRWHVRASADAPAWLVLRQPHADGIVAHVDGRRVELQLAGGIFCAVPLEAGTHEVLIAYQPRLPLVLVAVCWPVAVLFMLATAAAGWRRRR